MNTDLYISALSGLIQNQAALETMLEVMNDLGLEMTGIEKE